MEGVYNVILVIGGNGFIGYSAIKELVNRNIQVRCLDINRIEAQYMFKSVEYYVGDVWDRVFFQKVLENVDCVMDFVSTSMPNTSEITLTNEINNTLRYHDYILSSLNKCNIKKYIYPSSGGAVYGNKGLEFAYEEDLLKPVTPYGVGKKMTEDIIHYYYDKCGIVSCILRIGNVYGSPRIRSKAQGVIDVFVQNALCGEDITIWGNAKSSIRDYIYLEDVADAIAEITQKGFDDLKVYNIGTGIGTNLLEIIELIGKGLNKEIKYDFKDNMASGINSIILSNNKIKKEIGWNPKVSLEEGIRKTISIKRELLGIKANAM